MKENMILKFEIETQSLSQSDKDVYMRFVCVHDYSNHI
jgi:hypothetical protein